MSEHSLEMRALARSLFANGRPVPVPDPAPTGPPTSGEAPAEAKTAEHQDPHAEMREFVAQLFTHTD